jgi:hypothetical protein
VDGSLASSSGSDAVLGLHLSAASRSAKLTRPFWSRCTSEGELWLLLDDEDNDEAASDGGWFSARRMRSSHLRAGPLSSAPSTFRAFSGTISWNLREQPTRIQANRSHVAA